MSDIVRAGWRTRFSKTNPILHPGAPRLMGGTFRISPSIPGNPDQDYQLFHMSRDMRKVLGERFNAKRF